MGFRVFGSAEVLSVHTGEQQAAAHVRKQAHRAVFSYEPREAMVYVRSRAISSRCNDNFDYFGPAEIEAAYRTFIGKPVFVNHHNSDHRQARGVIIDAALHRDRNPDGSPDTWVEVLMEVDGKTYPKLAQALISGDIDRTSMGCDVQISKCSVCSNEARNPLEYCRHIPGMKGKRIFQQQPDGRRVGKLVYEECFGLSFFENSLLVEPPADPTAFFLGQVDVGPGLEHIAKAARLQQAAVESDRPTPAPAPAPMQRTAARAAAPTPNPLDVARQALAELVKQAGFLDDYPGDEEIDQMRAGTHPDNQGGFGGNREPWKPYRHQLEARPEPRTIKPPMVKGVFKGHNVGTVYEPVPHGTPGSQWAISPEDEYHGPYEVIRHAETGKYHVVDNAERRTYYGRRDGMDDVHQAQYLRDYAEHRQAGKEQARGLANSIFNKSMEVLDPGGTEESRESERHTRGMNSLLNHGYAPQQIKFDEDETPYGEVEHHLPNGRPSGWTGRDYGGSGYLHVHHRATGDEAHESIHLAENDEHGREYRKPGYGPAEAEQDLGAWHDDKEGGVREYLEGSDPRIQRWKRRMNREGAAKKQPAPKQPEPKKTSKADQFFVDNPVDPQNIVHLFKRASSGQKAEGMDWYAHMHRTARMITGGKVKDGKVVGGNPALGAGLLANYSQQSSLSDNHWKASKTALAGKGLWAGNAAGMYATKDQADKADRMLAGEHHSAVLGKPKTRNFAHLIEHSGDDHSGRTAVCVDRHALSAVIGRRVSDSKENDEFGTANLSAAPSVADKAAGHTENHRYRMVADAYRHAASQLSEELGESIAPHQVQAVTWVVQRDLNDEAERHEADPNKIKLIKGRGTKDKNETARWYGHVEKHFPEFHSQTEHWKMTSLDPRFAYNENKAPTDVDTLRDERCPICGNEIAFNGSECQVCGYIQPPKALGDPDVDKAKQLDQLKQSIDGEMDASGADPSRPGADFDAGDLDQLAPGGDNSADSWLGCTNCGTELRPAAPETTGDTPPGAEAPAGPTEGDICPVCQKGQLAATGTSEDDTDADALAEAEAEEDEESPENATDDSDPGSDEPPADDDDGDEDEDPKKRKKNPAGQATAAMKYRDHSKESPMNNALRALAAQQTAAEQHQKLIDHQQRTIASLHQRLAVKDSQIQRLTAGLAVVARHLGVEAETQVRHAMLTKRADEQNPAQPIPEPAPQPSTQSTADAETPEAFADVRTPGMVAGSNNDVAADAVTTAYTPGQDIATPPLRQLVDVTAPVAGTQGPRPLSEVKTSPDVRAGNTMNPQTAFPLNGPFAQSQRTSATQQGSEQDGVRTMASIRLARLQITAGIAQGDDLTVGTRIASDPSYSMDRINNEIAMLNQVRTAALQTQQTMPPRGAVPRPAGAAPVQRIVPPLSMTASRGGQAGYSDEMTDLEGALL